MRADLQEPSDARYRHTSNQDEAVPSLLRQTATGLRRPSLFTEQRAGLELMELLAHPVYYGIGIPRGNGAHILLIPGFLTSDSYMVTLEGWLRRIGYQPHFSGLHLNAGRPFDLIARLIGRLDALAATVGTPLTIIGHSLGGVFARILAYLRPDLVRRVITMGSPLAQDPHAAAHPFVRLMAEVFLHEGHPPAESAALRTLQFDLIRSPLPPNVRLMCLYSREDAVVHWQACIDTDPRARAHEVRGTHMGLAWNTQVYQHLGQLLLSM